MLVLTMSKKFTHLLEHIDHLRRDLVVTVLLVPGRVAVHLVHADDQLLHAQQVDEARVLAGLTLDLASLVVTTGIGEIKSS